MCQGLGPDKHDETSEIDRTIKSAVAPPGSARPFLKSLLCVFASCCFCIIDPFLFIVALCVLVWFSCFIILAS